MNFWEDDPNILAGKDLWLKGTWLGLNKKTLNFILMTNLQDPYYDNDYNKLKKRSWGLLLKKFLKSDFY